VFSFMTAIENVFTPQVYRQMFDTENQKSNSIGQYLTPFLYVSILLALVVSLLSEEVIGLLAPPDFHEAIDIVIILSMLLGSHFFGKVPQLVYAKKIFFSSLLTLVRIGLNVAVNIPFILKWGAIGAAWGAFLAGIAANVISFIISQRYYRIEWEYKKIILIFSVFFGSALFLIMLRRIGIPYEVRFIVKTVSLTCYLYMGARFGIITKENFFLVKKLIAVNK
jgi:O-antigen/teichoic acid export membrane protein